jgi:hypothetical protein
MAAGQGDDRALDLTRRIVGLNAGYTLLRVANTLVHQGGAADYEGVIRPAFAALGGNSLLQWIDIFNKITGTRNIESEYTRRLNVSNILRVYGRMHAMDIRSGPAAITGTAANNVTPHLVRMQLAAISDNYPGFVEAWKGAVAATMANDGALTVDEAETSVKRRFAERNPLKSVFHSIGTDEYDRMLAQMPESDRDVVGKAVDAFNRYSEALGVTPYYGSAKERVVKAPSTISEADLRAALVVGL